MPKVPDNITTPSPSKKKIGKQKAQPLSKTKKVERYEESLEAFNREMSFTKMKSVFAVGLTMIGFFWGMNRMYVPLQSLTQAMVSAWRGCAVSINLSQFSYCVFLGLVCSVRVQGEFGTAKSVPPRRSKLSRGKNCFGSNVFGRLRIPVIVGRMLFAVIAAFRVAMLKVARVGVERLVSVQPARFFAQEG